MRNRLFLHRCLSLRGLRRRLLRLGRCQLWLRLRFSKQLAQRGVQEVVLAAGRHRRADVNKRQQKNPEDENSQRSELVGKEKRNSRLAKCTKTATDKSKRREKRQRSETFALNNSGAGPKMADFLCSVKSRVPLKVRCWMLDLLDFRPEKYFSGLKSNKSNIQFSAGPVLSFQPAVFRFLQSSSTSPNNPHNYWTLSFLPCFARCGSFSHLFSLFFFFFFAPKKKKNFLLFKRQVR